MSKKSFMVASGVAVVVSAAIIPAYIITQKNKEKEASFQPSYYQKRDDEDTDTKSEKHFVCNGLDVSKWSALKNEPYPVKPKPFKARRPIQHADDPKEVPAVVPQRNFWESIEDSISDFLSQFKPSSKSEDLTETIYTHGYPYDYEVINNRVKEDYPNYWVSRKYYDNRIENEKRGDEYSNEETPTECPYIGVTLELRNDYDETINAVRYLVTLNSHKIIESASIENIETLSPDKQFFLKKQIEHKIKSQLPQ